MLNDRTLGSFSPPQLLAIRTLAISVISSRLKERPSGDATWAKGKYLYIIGSYGEAH